MRRPNVVGHKTGFPIRVTTTADRLPVSSPVDAWCECASVLKVDDLIVMGDGLLRRRQPVATSDELADAARRWAGRRGAARLRLDLDAIRPGTDSARETRLRLEVVRAGFPEPVPNAPLFDRRGQVVAHGDLVWPDYRVVLEYEGRQHAEDPAQFTIDIRRLDDIAEAGYRVIRVDATLLRARAELLRRLRTALADGGWRPGSGEGSPFG